MENEDLGTNVPTNEQCAQLGSINYDKRSNIESDVFINLLLKKFGTPPGDSCFDAKYHEHDFGTYKTVAYYYDSYSPRQQKYADKVLDRIPEKWTRLASKELKDSGYFDSSR